MGRRRAGMVAASLAIGGGVLLIAPVLGSQAQDHVSVAAAVLTDHSTPVRSAVPLPVCDYLPGQGYLEATAPGDVLAFGSATLHGTMMDTPLQAPVVGMAETPDGRGYWLVASDGGIFALGDAGFHGSMGGQLLDAPVVGMATTPDGGGYWLVASDGGIFAFGDAGFDGSMGNRYLFQPVAGMATTPDGRGYWLVASDGGIFAFGDATWHESMGGQHLDAPVVGLAATADGGGYLLAAADGGTFAFGDARFEGSPVGGGLLRWPVVGVSAVPAGASSPAAIPAYDQGGPNATGIADYYYAGAVESVPVGSQGASVEMCAVEPSNQSFLDFHTGTELTVESDPAATSAIEVVVASAPDVYGELIPHLLIGPWINGAPTYCGLPAGPSCGFVSAPDATIEPNMVVPQGVIVSYGVEHLHGQWNVYIDGQLMGWFPDTLWGGSFTQATYVQAFGEVASHPGVTPTAIMGNGNFGDGWQADHIQGFEALGPGPPAAFQDAFYSNPAYYDVGSPNTDGLAYGGPGG